MTKAKQGYLLTDDEGYYSFNSQISPVSYTPSSTPSNYVKDGSHHEN